MTQEELFKSCALTELSDSVLAQCAPFSCGEQDLDDFFAHDALIYHSKLIGRTYLFVTREEPRKIVVAFTMANDSIRMTSKLNETSKDLFLDEAELRDKEIKRYPGILLGRLGTNKEFAGQGYGTAAMDFIKNMFRAEKRSGCRFLIVDALNNPDTLHYYEKNGFKYLIEEERLEAKYVGIGVGRLPLNTRLMYFDLIKIKVDNN